VRITQTEELSLEEPENVVRVRQSVRSRMVEEGFSLVEQTKMVTAASELARNAVAYGGGGVVRIEQLQEGARVGLRIVVTDQGPGILDLELALTDGYTTGHGLGLGLSGSKRLVDEFAIKSNPGEGTVVAVTLWR
jgi:serine/threonine-protein kinase RsbT